MKKILLLDNYDSFTYNLVQYLEELLGYSLDVVHNDEITLEEVDDYELIILSPGPGLPSEAGIMPSLLRKYASSKRILGVCLGHQAIIENFGGKIRNLKKVYHGVASPIKQTKQDNILFSDIDSEFLAGRYHSWSGVIDQMPKELKVTAVDGFGEIMAIEHQSFPVFGVQFHPESIMTAVGKKILANFLEIPYTVTQADFALINVSR